MDQKSQEYLDQILKKDPGQLTEAEVRFLKARQSYLKNSQLLEYKDVLEQQDKKAVSYTDLLQKAKELGYKGARLRRSELNKFIKENS